MLSAPADSPDGDGADQVNPAVASVQLGSVVLVGAASVTQSVLSSCRKPLHQSCYNSTWKSLDLPVLTRMRGPPHTPALSVEVALLRIDVTFAAVLEA